MLERIPIRRIVKWAGYPLFFLACFIFFAYKTFPYDRLAERLVREAQLRGYEIEIADLTNSGLTGLSFENLRVIMPSDEDGSPPLDIIFEELTVGTSLFSMLSDTKSYTFDAELGGGDVEGDITLGVDIMELDLEIDDINLESLPGLRSFTKRIDTARPHITITAAYTQLPETTPRLLLLRPVPDRLNARLVRFF